METMIEELIAVGASVTANCQPCLEYHVQKAKENGAGDAQIKRAIEVAKMVRKGAAAKMDKVIAGAVSTTDAATDTGESNPCSG